MSEPRVSFIVIGLNEAKHLAESITSCGEQGLAREEFEILYVDSGSSDGSIEVARAAGADRILELERRNSNAARARNAGLREASGEFVHFVDGDTRLEPGWLRHGIRALEEDARLAGVEGDLRELRPAANLYHAVCELDWPASPGEVSYASGNSLYRAEAIREAGGFDPRMELGEEPELGTRLRDRGWRFLHLDRVMARHDLDMMGPRDWFRRGYRSGLACAMVVRATGGLGRGFWHERLTRTLIQGGILVAPLALASVALSSSPVLALAILACFGVVLTGLVVRKARRMQRQGVSHGISLAYGLHIYLVKIPSAVGILAAFGRGLPHSTRSNQRD